MMDFFLAPLQETYFQKALLGASIVAIVSGVVGTLVILRKMAFLGDALAHAMIAGVAGGYLFMKLIFGYEAHAPGMLIGSLLAAIVTVALISFVSRISRIKEDASIGIMYTGIFALGVVMVSVFRHYIHIDLMHFIMGDVLGVTDVDLWLSAFIAAIVLSILIIFFRYFQVATFDPIMAASIGLPVLLLDYVLTTCVSLVVVSAVSMVGVILVVGLLITPAATAYLLSDRLDHMMALSAFFGVTSVVGGLYLCIWLDSAGGGAIILFCTLQFLLVLCVAPKYGLFARWWRHYSMVPQQLVEDILAASLRNGGMGDHRLFYKYVDGTRKDIQKALRFMVKEELFHRTDAGFNLSEKGEEQAQKVLRAHRLWEAYLEKIGMPKEDLHKAAHNLEHMQDGEAVAYLDEKLGAVEFDPHGKKIPSAKV